MGVDFKSGRAWAPFREEFFYADQWSRLLTRQTTVGSSIFLMYSIYTKYTINEYHIVLLTDPIKPQNARRPKELLLKPSNIG